MRITQRTHAIHVNMFSRVIIAPYSREGDATLLRITPFPPRPFFALHVCQPSILASNVTGAVLAQGRELELKTNPPLRLCGFTLGTFALRAFELERV